MMLYLGCHIIDLMLQFKGSMPDEVIPFNASIGHEEATNRCWRLAEK